MNTQIKKPYLKKGFPIKTTHMGIFHSSLSDSQTPQNSHMYLQFFEPLFSKFLYTIPSTSTTTGITATVIFHSFFLSLASPDIHPPFLLSLSPCDLLT